MKHLYLFILALFFTSCAGLQPPVVTEDGCFLTPITYEERTYFVGRCSDKRTVFQWSANNGEAYRAYRSSDGQITYYVEREGRFVRLGAKEPAPPEAPPSDLQE